MEYRIYQLNFRNGVHFGKRDLDDSEYTFRADTLFSALCQEALKIEVLPQFYSLVSEGRITFSDAFPYTNRNHLYLPKPIVRLNIQGNQGEGKQKKLYKKTKFIALDDFDDFLAGTLSLDQKNEMENLGCFEMKTSVAIRGYEEPQPYRVNAYYFNEENGLYFIAALEDKVSEEMLEKLMYSLSYSGIGGKRSAGYGSFELTVSYIPEKMLYKLQDKGNCSMLLSSALPEDQELDPAIEGSSYQLLKRSGFVASETYADTPLRKKDVYLFASGSCFKNRFWGSILDVSYGGTHPVYRYARALFMGVNV